MNKPAIVLVCGLKNTGKTWMMNELIHYFSKKGYRVGSIKHDGHEFDSDVNTHDSDLHYQAGACTSAVFSKHRWAMIKDETQTLEDMIQKIKGVDIIFVEGCKNSVYPKIEMLRKGYSEIPVSNVVGRFATVVDFSFKGEHVYLRNDLSQIFTCISTFIKGDQYA